MGRPRVGRVKVTCAACGTEVEKYPFQVEQNKTGRFFCSEECRVKLGTRVRRLPPKTCEWCEKQFYSYNSANRPRGRFCSKKCYDTWQRRRRVDRTCEQCGKTFDLKPSQVEHVSGRFCSRACESVSRIKRPLDREYNGKPAVLDRNGYVRVYEPSHPKATKAGWQFEHRIIVEKRIGRYLEPHEHVHHVNGVKHDNRAENLVAMDDLEHLVLSGSDYRQEVAAAMAELAEYRRRYGPLDDPDPARLRAAADYLEKHRTGVAA